MRLQYKIEDLLRYDGRGKLAVKHIGHRNGCGMLRKAASHVQGH